MKKYLALSLLLTAGGALAQQVNPYSLTFDMEAKPLSAAYCPGALSVLCNPAELAWGQGMEFFLAHRQLMEKQQEQFNRAGSDGLFLQVGGLGLGLQWVRPLEEQERYNYLKFSLGLPLFSIGKWLAAGAALEVLDPTNTGGSAAVDVSAGLLLRPVRWVSLGLTGRNLGRAAINDLRAERVLDLALAVRPLWFAPERATLAVDWRLVDNRSNPPLAFSAWLNLFDGVSLFGRVDLDGNFTAGVGLDFLNGGFSGLVQANTSRVSSVIFTASAYSQPRRALSVGKNKTALVKLDAQLGEDLTGGSFWSRKKNWFDVVLAIEQAARDEQVDSLLLRVEDPPLDWSLAEELRDAILAFRAQGKKALVHLRDADNVYYYLATAADAILLDPAGSFMVTGPHVEALFLGGALQMLGINPEYQRVGDYKTAVDMLTREEPSPAHREVLESLADEADALFVEALSVGRKIDKQKVRQLLDRGLMTPEQAREEKLVDALAVFEESDQQLAELLGHRPAFIRNYRYRRSYDYGWGGQPRIALVNASGGIAYRRSLFDDLDAHELAGLIKQLREDDSIKAVVLRVDSPGGSGSASDLVWQQLKLLKNKKPLVVSMGRVAASGGYYISAPADVIVAQPSTITGSIGVFALLFDLSELYANLGISKEIIKRNRLSDLFTTFRPRSEEEMEVLGNSIRAFYQIFIQKVAEGRKKTPEEIDRIGRGRVWTGRQAKENGLVDELGGLSRALKIAREKIGLPESAAYQVVYLPKRKFGLEQLSGWLSAREEVRQWYSELPAEMKYALQLVSFGEQQLLTVLPFGVVIK